MILSIQEHLGKATREAVSRLFGVDLPTVGFQYPPRPELGDLALTAPFDLARALRKPPRQIAEALTAELAKAPGVARAEVAGGGYVNVFLQRGAFALEMLGGEKPLPRVAGRTIVEHTSINPNKAAHIGHLRNAILGDTFVRVLKHRGREVGIQNYIDDTGVQVADVVVGFRHLERKTLAEVAAIQERFDYYCWDLYARVGDFYAENPAVNKKLQAETFHALESGHGEIAELAAHVAGRIVDAHLATMARLDIHYELLVHESDILKLDFWARAFELLKEQGAIRLETEGKQAGCWVLSMEEVGTDEDKIIVRSNGTVTYTGKDIAYQLWKLGRLDRDFRYRRHPAPGGGTVWSTTSGEGEAGAPSFGHAQHVYNVIDVGQSYPQRVVKAGVAALGHADAAEGSHHLAYEKVTLSPATAEALGYKVEGDGKSVKVSGRKGLGVKADDLVDALVAKARAEIDSRDAERPVAEREAAAQAIAIGALRYFLLKYSLTTIVTFDMEQALAFTGETGPYIQNAVVRARNILHRLRADGHDVPALLAAAAKLDLDAFLGSEEGQEVWSLLFLMARTEEVAEQVVRTEEVSLLARHAFAVAQGFHSYYQQTKYSVLRAENEDARAFRTMVVHTFVGEMVRIAGLLGIPVPEKM